MWWRSLCTCLWAYKWTFHRALRISRNMKQIPEYVLQILHSSRSSLETQCRNFEMTSKCIFMFLEMGTTFEFIWFVPTVIFCWILYVFLLGVFKKCWKCNRLQIQWQRRRSTKSWPRIQLGTLQLKVPHDPVGLCAFIHFLFLAKASREDCCSTWFGSWGWRFYPVFSQKVVSLNN